MRIDPGQSLGVPEPTDPITGEVKSRPKPKRARVNRAGRDRQAMKDFAAQELAAQDAVVLQRLQDHLSQDHGPLGHTNGIQGAAWTDLARLEAAHLKLHETWKGHTH